jgi:hypothetical protein
MEAKKFVLTTRLNSTDSVARSLQAFAATRSKKHGHLGTFHGHQIFFITARFTAMEGDIFVLNKRLNSIYVLLDHCEPSLPLVAKSMATWGPFTATKFF